MLDVVAPHKHELPLTVQTERVDQPEPRLARSASRHIQPVGENEPVKERQPHQDGDPAGRQNSDLDDPVVAERKVTQPLHAESALAPPTAQAKTHPLGAFAFPTERSRQNVSFHVMDPAGVRRPRVRRNAHLGSGWNQGQT